MVESAISKHRQVLGTDVLQIPGLMLLGHHVSSRAAFPLEPHMHANCLEFVVVVSGNERYFVDDKLYELSGNDVFVSWINQQHSNGDTPQGVSEIIWFQIDPSAPDLLGLSRDQADKLRRQLLALDVHMLKADRECLLLLKKSLDGFLKREPSGWPYAVSLFVSFLFRLLFMQKQPASGETVMKKAVAYIHEHIDENISIQELSDFCGLSQSGFKHAFKECTGASPRDYINHHKIIKARTLLQSGLSVTDTAMTLSFSSSEYFAAVFKKYTTLTPSQYRGRCRIV